MAACQGQAKAEEEILLLVNETARTQRYLTDQASERNL